MAEEDKLFLYSLIGLPAGLLFFYKGFGWMKQKRLMENTPTSKVRSIAMGFVEVSGQAVAAKNKILKSPFTGHDVVYYRYKIERLQRSGKHARWVTVKSGEEGVHFYLKDDTGMVLVDPKGAKVDVKMDFEFNSSWGKDPPDKVKSFLEDNNLSFEGFLGINKTMRYREHIVKPDDNIYILGTAGDNPFVEDASEAEGYKDIMISGGKGNIYRISDKSEKEMLGNLGNKSLGGIYGGAALSLACLGYILFYLGLF